MEINWTIVVYIVIGYFAISGFSKGWWTEAITTIILAVLIFFLQNPDWAQSLVTLFNEIIAYVWNILPSSITSLFDSGLAATIATDPNFGPPQIDATAPETWITVLLLLVGGAILFGQNNFGHSPTGLGKILGGFIGGLNGFLILNIVREYLDGRALPGRALPTSEITLAGNSSFGPAASNISIQATGLPSMTIMDSIIPWLAIGLGVLFVFSVFKARVGIATNQAGMRKISYKIPPFYKIPPPQSRMQPNPPVTPVRVVE